MTALGSRRIGWLLLGLLAAVSASGQAVTRRATNLATLLAYPGFYHGRAVLVVGTVATANAGQPRVSSDAGSLPLLTKGAVGAPDGLDEIRGEFVDLGRLTRDDPRLAGYDLKTALNIDADATWPRPGQVLAIAATRVSAAEAPVAPTVRTLTLFPGRYLDQKVTVTGQFAGRNLLGDLPDAPGRSANDFVIRTADSAIWVTGLRPRGRDFELVLDARIDTGRWVQVSGVMREGRGLQWIDGVGGTIALAKPAAEAPADEAPVPAPPAPPPEVVFSAPTTGETDVPLTTNVRIQFSRDLDPATIKGHVTVSYSEGETRERGEFVTPSVAVTTQYTAGTRVLELKFAEPLERFRTIRIDLTGDILGTDHQPLKPWSLTFQTGA